MCCSTRLQMDERPTDEALHTLLKVAGFKQMHEEGADWLRNIDAVRWVKVTVNSDGSLRFSLTPSIQTHTAEAHAANAYGASVLFKTAMTLAEKYGGVIEQLSLVGECRLENNGEQNMILATYPSHPLAFENLCAGFRDVLARGVGQDIGDALQ